MSKHTLEQVLEALINKEEDRASELLHQFFVAKGKSIYEELSQFDEAAEDELDESEEEIEEGIGGDAARDFRDEVLADEEELNDEQLFAEDEEGAEDDMAADEPTEPEATADLAMGDEAGVEGAEGAEGEAEEALDKVEDALQDLRAAFAEIMGGAAPAGDDMADMGGEEEAGADDFEAMGESVAMKAVPAPTHGDDGENKKSPVATSKRIDGNGAAPVKITGDGGKGGTEGGVLKPSTSEINSGNVNKVGNAKAPAPKSVAVPKNSDTAGNKTSPVAKS